MEIDTLILPGGGPCGGVAYPSVFQALYDTKTLNPGLQGITHIVCTSAGILMALCLLLDLNLPTISEIIMRYDVSQYLNCEEIHIDRLLFKSGLFDTSGVRHIIQSLIKNTLKREDITLQHLYDMTQIQLTVKVFNITDKSFEFVSYQNEPTLSVITLCEMTTAIPVLFTPVIYNDKLYCDGGFRHGYPYGSSHSSTYLGIYLNAGDNQSFRGFPFPLIHTLLQIVIGEEFEHSVDPRIIDARLQAGYDFHMDVPTKQQIQRDAYNHTIEHLTHHSLTRGNQD